MTESIPVRYFEGRDGARLAYRETGDGPPIILIHGIFSNSYVNWIRYGHAGTIAESGWRVIMPDLRAHGDSAKPHEPVAYPPDVLTDDGLALIEHLGLTDYDYDLGGYSLGARTVVRMLVRGATPRRAIIAGTGLEPIVDAVARAAYFRRVLTSLGTFERGTSEWRAEMFMKSAGGDPLALLGVVNSFVDTPRHSIEEIQQPALVLSGAEDNDHGSVSALAGALPNARYVTIPGSHMSAVANRELGEAITEFLNP